MSLSAKKIFYGIALTIAAIAFWGCSQPVDPPADITWTAEADGASGATTSTKINLTFAGAVTGLTAEQITLTSVTGTAAKGAISGEGANWSLGLAVETAGDLTLAIDKAGVESGAKTVTVHKQAAAQGPGDETADPEDETSDPEDETSDPENETSDPEDETSDPEDETTDPEEETAVLTDTVKLLQGEGDEWATGIISGEGAAQTMTLAVVEEPLAYFAIEKTAAQTIAVSNDGGNKVIQAEEDEILGGQTASDIFALFSVNMEDLLFDGAFGESGAFNADAIPAGMETRTFTLTVTEDGKAPREIAVSLNITLDDTTETSIYHREGTPGNYHYAKVRDAALTTDDNINHAHASNNNFAAFDVGPVTDLQNAFVWVDHYGVTGASNTGYTSGTTEGYSEYRLFLKKSQQIGKIGLAFKNRGEDTRDNMSVELYGAGSPGSKELKITRNAQYSTSTTQVLNQSSVNMTGFISLKPTKKMVLVLGKNITIDAEGKEDDVNTQFRGSGSGGWKTLAVTYLVAIESNTMLIMDSHSKLTGCYIATIDSSYCAINIPDAFSGKFVMKGGMITGNVVGNGVIKAYEGTVTLSGGTIVNNTNYSTGEPRNNIFW